ncbi:MAG: hypothetical protein M3O23_00395 [Actinomycetota bacterium]|nr:hypothetical protein [Actinomycetota bacterium]
MLVLFGALFVACGEDDVDTGATTDTVEERSTEAREQAENAFASFRTEAERLMDDIRARNAPEAKQVLLDRCRDALEQLRQANSDQTDRVDDLCNRIRDTEPTDTELWRQVQEEISKLPQG